MTKSFFNEDWQELESQTGSEITSYIWGLRYTDDLVLREKGEERLYSLADPNWNVVALVNASGSVVERMKYDAFGKISWLDNNFSTKNGSDCNWNRTFTGQVWDNETKLMLYRMRYYNMELGRFVNRDPIVYEAKDTNIYRYLFNNPSLRQDFYGTSAFIGGGLGCVGGATISALGAWWSGGNVACAAAGGCVSGAIVGAFPSVAAGCIGSALGSVVDSVCKNWKCYDKNDIPCDIIKAMFSGVVGCLGGAAAGLDDHRLKIVTGIMGFDTSLIWGMCDM